MMAWTVQYNDSQIPDPFAERLGHNRDYLFDRISDRQYFNPCSLHVTNDLRAIGQFHHVEGRNVFQGSSNVRLRRCCGQAADRTGQSLCHVRCPIDRVQRQVKFMTSRYPGSKMLTLEDSGSIVLYPLADHYLTANIHE